LCKACFL